MENAFVAIVPTRPCPLFGRPVHRRDGSHRFRPGASPQALRIPPRGGHPALPDSHRGQRGVTPAFGYGALHPSTSGTSTHLSTSLPSAHYEPVRLPLVVHHRRTSFDFPMRPAVPAGDDGISRLPRKVFPRMLRVFDRAGSASLSRCRDWRCGLPLTPRASAPRRARPKARFSFRGSIARPAHAPVNASPSPLRTPPHDSGSVWLATPSPYDSCIHDTLPVCAGARVLKTKVGSACSCPTESPAPRAVGCRSAPRR
jgi:hypothetical protein